MNWIGSDDFGWSTAREKRLLGSSQGRQRKHARAHRFRAHDSSDVYSVQRIYTAHAVHAFIRPGIPVCAWSPTRGAKRYRLSAEVSVPIFDLSRRREESGNAAFAYAVYNTTGETSSRRIVSRCRLKV